MIEEPDLQGSYEKNYLARLKQLGVFHLRLRSALSRAVTSCQTSGLAAPMLLRGVA
jgi:hypothetical protein